MSGYHFAVRFYQTGVSSEKRLHVQVGQSITQAIYNKTGNVLYV